MRELERLLQEVKEVYQEEKAEGNIEDWQEKQRFIQETVDLYIEKIKMNRYDRELILEELLKEDRAEQFNIYAEERMVSLKEMLDKFLIGELEMRIREELK